MVTWLAEDRRCLPTFVEVSRSRGTGGHGWGMRSAAWVLRGQGFPRASHFDGSVKISATVREALREGRTRPPSVGRVIDWIAQHEGQPIGALDMILNVAVIGNQFLRHNLRV